MGEIVIEIRFTPGQPPMVTGPVENKILCYGLLEVAKDIIRDFRPETSIQSPAGDEVKKLLAERNKR